MYGTLERTPDGARLRFVRKLAHPPEKVWRALTSAEHLAAWFPQTIVVDEWAPGAPLRFTGDPNVSGSFDGEVLAAKEPSLLEFRWGTDVLRFELEPDGDGTRLTFVDTIGELGKAARDGAGWHVCLDGLERHLNGDATEESRSDGWRRVHAAYVEQFGPEAATIGPPEGALSD
jgi:uncharacterized protein YndB with AHSA1/START domain